MLSEFLPLYHLLSIGGYTAPYSVFSTSAAVSTCHFEHKNSRYYINFTAHNAGLACLGDIMYVVSCKGSMWQIPRLLPYQATSLLLYLPAPHIHHAYYR